MLRLLVMLRIPEPMLVDLYYSAHCCSLAANGDFVAPSCTGSPSIPGMIRCMFDILSVSGKRSLGSVTCIVLIRHRGCRLGCDLTCSAHTLAWNFLQGDWGTQFGMLIQFLSEAGPGGLTDPAIADLELPQLQVCLPSLQLITGPPQGLF